MKFNCDDCCYDINLDSDLLTQCKKATRMSKKWSKGFVFMGRVMGCGLCPYNAIEKVGNYVIGQSRSISSLLHFFHWYKVKKVMLC